MKFRFHPAARQEFVQASLFYDEKQSGLGQRFIGSVDAAIRSLVSAPESWPFLEEPVRRRLTRVFPYAVLYVVREDSILIVAVMHCHQEPGYWKDRLA